MFEKHINSYSVNVQSLVCLSSAKTVDKREIVESRRTKQLDFS